MRAIFVDTGAWAALTAEDDAHHKEARHIYPSLLQGYRKLVTTNLVEAFAFAQHFRVAGFQLVP